MDLNDLRREKVLTDIISERDAMILALVSEKEKLVQKMEELEKQFGYSKDAIKEDK